MFKSVAFHRNLLSAVLTLVFLLHVSSIINIPFINKIENIVYDYRLKSTMENTVDPRIVILDIDEKSLAKEGRWPWSRNKLSQLVNVLFERYDISVLGFDIVFSEPDTSSGLTLIQELEKNELRDDILFTQVAEKLKPQLNFDQLFADSFKDRPIVLGYYFNSSNQNINPNSALPLPIKEQSGLYQLPIPTEKGFGANLETLQSAAIYGGYFNNNNVDSDGSYRRLPLLSRYDNQVYETLSLAIYRRFMDQAELRLGLEQGYNGKSELETINIRALSIPVDKHSVVLVPYRGKQNSFNYISATDVLHNKVSLDDLQGKIVLVGTTAAGLLDLRTTPVQNVYPGVEVHANLISGMLDNSFKSKPSYLVGAEFLTILLLSLFVIFIFPKLSSIFSLIIFAIMTATIVWFNIYLWQHINIDYFLATPLLLLSLLFSIQIYFGYFFEAKKKNELSKSFGQYIPSELVKEMSQSSDNFSLEGESKEMTVLFSDVRGFTTISENIPPKELSILINEILTPITHVIHHNSGTIDKYIGDAVMAFWNAPITDKNHAFNAVKAALEFIPVLAQINIEFQKKNWPDIDIGIGVNTGVMSVGNMGSEFRMAYTVMGDAVNLGARLEGLTKQYGVRILVSEFTKQAAPEFSYLKLDIVKVKGKNEPVTIYEPLCLAAEITADLEQQTMQFELAFEYYVNQCWDKAATILQNLIAHYPDKPLFQLYLDRVNEYANNPPGNNWDGTFTHKTK